MDRRKIEMLIYLIGFLDLFGVSLILPLLMPQLKSFGLSHISVGLISSLYGAIQLFSSPIVGRWSDCWGRKPVMLVSLFSTAMSYFIVGSSVSIIVFVFGRIIAGTFKHSQTLLKALLTDITSSAERQRVFGTFNAIANIGFIVGPIVGGHMSDVENGFALICNMAGFLFLISLVLFWYFIPISYQSSPNGKTETEEDSFVNSISQFGNVDWAVFLDIFSVRFFLYFATLVYRSNFTLLIGQNLSATPRMIGYLISMQAMISVTSGFFIGYIAHWYRDSLRELLHASFILAGALLGLTFAPSLAAVILFSVPLCFSTAVIRVAGASVTVNRCSPSQVGSVTGCGQSIASLARMLSPLAAGICLEISAYGPGITGSMSALVGAAMVQGMLYNAKVKQE